MKDYESENSDWAVDSQGQSMKDYASKNSDWAVDSGSQSIRNYERPAQPWPMSELAARMQQMLSNTIVGQRIAQFGRW